MVRRSGHTKDRSFEIPMGCIRPVRVWALRLFTRRACLAEQAVVVRRVQAAERESRLVLRCRDVAGRRQRAEPTFCASDATWRFPS